MSQKTKTVTSCSGRLNYFRSLSKTFSSMTADSQATNMQRKEKTMVTFFFFLHGNLLVTCTVTQKFIFSPSSLGIIFRTHISKQIKIRSLKNYTIESLNRGLLMINFPDYVYFNDEDIAYWDFIQRTTSVIN